MTNPKPPGSQEWMLLQTNAPEDPDMCRKPPGDYDLKAAQESLEIAEIYLQYIAEDISQGKKLSPTAKRYHADCWRRVADGEKLDIAFNLVGKKGRTESTVERNINIVGRYYARKNEGELGKDIIKDFWEKYGILESTFDGARSQHRPFCEEHWYLWSEEKVLDIFWPDEELSNIEKIERYEAGKTLLAKYIQQCKSKDMKAGPTKRTVKTQPDAQGIISSWLLGKEKP